MISKSNVALIALLALAGTARAQDLDAKYAKGDLIGEGSFKKVYSVKDARTGAAIPDIVLITQDKTEPFKEYTRKQLLEMIPDEDRQLERLERAGVPVARYRELGTLDGKPAGIQKRYAKTNHEWTYRYRGHDKNQERKSKESESRWTVMNERSVKTLAQARRAIERAGLYVRDPQFLVAEDGSFAMADPLEVRSADEIDADTARRWKIRMDSLLDILERQASDAVAARKAARANAKAAAGDTDAIFEDAIRAGRRALGDLGAKVGRAARGSARGETSATEGLDRALERASNRDRDR
jgi:hypothetical protein